MKSGRETYLQFFRYYHYLKNLKFSQIFSYFSFKHNRKKLCFTDSNRIAVIAENLKQNFKIDDNQKNIEFCFLNYPISISIDEMKWKQKDFVEDVGKYWITELNSFDYINKEKITLSIEQVSCLIIDWIAKNGNENSETWEPYPLSKRLTAWVKWLNSNQIQNEIVSIMKLSISQQLKRLFVDMEYHRPANHLLENIRGFLFGCSSIINSSQYFNNESEFQLEEVLNEAIKQISLQILKDGGHFERSPMYHLLVLDNVNDIKNISQYLIKQKFLRTEILEKTQKLLLLCDEKAKIMTDWLEALTMPDGDIAQFNDSSRIKGFKHSFDSLTQLFEYSGFFVKHESNYSFILSCGDPSPAFLPEHSHCDILSYELAIDGIRAIIDSGCSRYDKETLRTMSRETEAHNLPMVEHHEQSDIWGNFSFGKRAKILRRTFNSDKSELDIIIQDQFNQILSRNVVFSEKKIEISDSLKNHKMQGCFVSLIHLAPGIETEISENDNNKIIICKMTNETKFSIITKANVRLTDYISFPEFGKSLGAKMLVLSNKEAEELNYVIKW